MKKEIKIMFDILAGALTFVIGYVCGMEKNRRNVADDVKVKSSIADKYYSMYMLCNQWLIAKNKNLSVGEYLRKRKVRNVAVYGMAELGELLYEELRDTDIDIKYGIDRNKDVSVGNIPVFRVEDKLTPVDMIIVTSVYYFDDVKASLEKKNIGEIVSLEEIIYDL